MLYTDSWMIGGPFGQGLYKLVTFTVVSPFVSIQSLVLIAVDQFGAVVFPPCCPLFKSKLCPFFIFATWIIGMASLSPYLFAMNLSEYPGGLGCWIHWNQVFGESSSFKNHSLVILVIKIPMPWVLIAILNIITFLKLKSETIPLEQSANTESN